MNVKQCLSSSLILTLVTAEHVFLITAGDELIEEYKVNMIYDNTGSFFNPVKSNVFLGETYIAPTRKILVTFFHQVLKIFGCKLYFCNIFLFEVPNVSFQKHSKLKKLKKYTQNPIKSCLKNPFRLHF